MDQNSSGRSDILKAIGLVFGDIGTSPIYTLTVIFTLTQPTPEHIFGVISLVFWTLIFLVTIEYWWLAMSLSIKGEGGVLVLKEIVITFLKKGRKANIAAFLGYIGISLLMGDGVITPAISILSAVEGIPLIPGFSSLGENGILIITIVITFLLFLFQYKGTDKVATSFGPIMVLWFGTLFLSGVVSVVSHPSLLGAVSPMYAIDFLLHNGWAGYFVLSEVILCATGGEALYADMGHLGAKPIKSAWIFVFFALIMNYFGQGAYLLSHPHTNLILFEMVRSQVPYLYIPFLILTITATIIASQAMISAVFSLVYQGITTRMFPLLKIKYTSTHLKSQIYIGAVNWALMFSVILMILIFRKSSNLAAAYGFAVTTTMTLSAIFMIWIFNHSKDRVKFSAAILVLIIDLLFLGALLEKIPHGGYWSIIIASVPLGTTILWVEGQKKIHRAFRSLPFDVFLLSYEQIYSRGKTIDGTALFFTRNLTEIPPYIVHTMISSHIMYEKNILISVQRTDSPYNISTEFLPELGPGLQGIIIRAGYQEILDIVSILKRLEITEKVIFYGMEEISTDNFLLKIYAILKKLSPSFIQFYKLPYRKIHGVVTRLEI